MNPDTNSTAPEAAGDVEITDAAPADPAEIVAPAPADTPPPHNNKRTPEQQTLALLALIESGVSAREAASQVGVNIRTCYGILARHDTDIDDARAAIRKLLQAEALQRLDDWRVASDVGARKRGNHGPAKDWLLHAGVIDQLDSDSGSVRIAINIGTDEKPMRIPSPLSYKVDTDTE